MTTVTLTSKGQLTLPRPLRDALGLVPGARLQASIDREKRLVLVPLQYRCLCREQMGQSIVVAVGNPDDRGDA